MDRAERNRIFQSMARAFGSLKAAQAPIEDALGIHLNRGRPKKKEIDKNTGLVRTVDATMDRFGDNAVQFKWNGDPLYFVFDDRAVADAARRWSSAALPGPLHGLLWLQNKMKSLWTHYSPNFLVRHNARYYAPIEDALGIHLNRGRPKTLERPSDFRTPAPWTCLSANCAGWD
jgi:hypothetical protein